MRAGSLIHPEKYVSGLCFVAQVADGGDTLAVFSYRDGCDYLLLKFFVLSFSFFFSLQILNRTS